MWEGVGSERNNDKNLFISAFRHHHEKQLTGPDLELQFSDWTLVYTDTFFLKQDKTQLWHFSTCTWLSMFNHLWIKMKISRTFFFFEFFTSNPPALVSPCSDGVKV